MPTMRDLMESIKLDEKGSKGNHVYRDSTIGTGVGGGKFFELPAVLSNVATLLGWDRSVSAKTMPYLKGDIASDRVFLRNFTKSGTQYALYAANPWQLILACKVRDASWRTSDAPGQDKAGASVIYYRITITAGYTFEGLAAEVKRHAQYFKRTYGSKAAV